MKKILKALLVFGVFGSLFVLAACGGDDDDNVIRIGATAVPHSEILAHITPALEEQGFEVELRVFNDFIAPNIALNEGDIDINFFQHRPFLQGFNADNNANLVPVFGVHFEPLRLYANTPNTSLDSLGANAIIAIPNDPTNEARALQLLESLELITLYDETRTTANATQSIAQNPLDLDIRPMAADVLASVLADVDFAVINGNFALQGGVIHLAVEGSGEDTVSSAAQEFFTNFVVVRDGYQDDARVLALIDALNSQSVRDFIDAQYQGRVVPTFLQP
ncbi:MAG: MetQ/NlpA family ABC transporter substrate-binding protein [Defluviitaleaceae bacterium]|nr:MetQ/NlpA family ABC transporter substrate-binding protein [Defluviitaleaceae bacterium]